MTKVIVLRAAGTNCDLETAYAFKKHQAEVDLIHINELKSKKRKLSSYHILAIPGGFTYGDDVAAGRILANELRFNLKEDLAKFIQDGKLIIGICNGFQVLVKAGLLPDCESLKQKATLTLNDSGKFEDRWVYLKKPETPEGQAYGAGRNQKPPKDKPTGQAEDSDRRESRAESRGNQKPDSCVWTKDINEIIYLPVAHAEGKFITDKDTLEELKENNQIIFQYVDKEGKLERYPYNPNGSVENIAGICDKTGRILGLMPHPERSIMSYHHPHWQKNQDIKEGDGKLIFKNAVSYIKSRLL